MNYKDLLLKMKGMKFDAVNVAGILGLFGVNADNISLDAARIQVMELSKELQGIVDSDGLVTALIVGALAWYNKGKK